MQGHNLVGVRLAEEGGRDTPSRTESLSVCCTSTSRDGARKCPSVFLLLCLVLSLRNQFSGGSNRCYILTGVSMSLKVQSHMC